ncbi:hypothetical protein BO94DRAFT_629363 [Aspergillus sclerotioniger CBS 115572]|uniref:HAD-like protein n=1 Tax=Aspergillus sclerotioniger CBS 115572 TaxID=1450535 RepID=A0A317UT33_9EURO|nr:hypothetical protein BO94DRAFT_629363 [Aspergillus sclerotioniger CBS 115572]PWY64288.1 hypothetical protein BO94DRAFT_629363 [Aspergillus sclerotioniger CBS 115572]
MIKMTPQKQPQYKAIIFDLGGVLFTWEPSKDILITPILLQSILSSQIWHDYKRGTLTQEDCYQALATQFSIDVSEIALTFNQPRQSLTTNLAGMTLILEMNTIVPKIAVYAISKPDDAVLLQTNPKACIFDRIFPSGLHSARKPQLGFYQKVLDEVRIPPEQIIFIDNQLGNIISAQSIGMHSILYTQPSLLSQNLKNSILDPVQRGMEYLRRHAKALHSTVDDGQVVLENFSQLLILEATGDETLISLKHHESTWNFFQGPPTFTTSTFPDDVDTTSLAWLILPAPKPMISALLDRITTSLVNEDGIVTTYFTPHRPRTDPVVCTNVLRLLHKYNYNYNTTLPSTLHYIHTTLHHRTYLHGTRYYPTPESFLYAVSQLCAQDPSLTSLKEVLVERLQERMNVEVDALALGMRILACLSMGFTRGEVEGEVEELVLRQCEDGSWPAGLFCRFGVSGVGMWNRGLGTAVGVRVLRVYSV